MSVSSVGSEHQGFIFPIIEEAKPDRCDSKNVPPKKINKCQRTESFKTAVLDNAVENSQNLENRYSCSQISNAGTTFSEYDPEKFLRNALGDVSSLSESGICNVSKFFCI